MKNLLLLLLLTSLLAGCKGGGTAPEPTKTDLLSKKWNLQKLSGNGTVYGSTNWKTAEFRADGTCEFTYASANPFNGTWAFNSNETKIIVGTSDYTIITLTGSQLILEYTDTNYKNGQVTYRAEFVPA